MDVADTIHELEEVVTCKPHWKSSPTLQEGEEVCTRAVLQDDVGNVLSCV